MMVAGHSRILRKIPLLITVCLVGIPTQAQYGGGSSSAGRPLAAPLACALVHIFLRKKE
jgi:hypothetical protein